VTVRNIGEGSNGCRIAIKSIPREDETVRASWNRILLGLLVLGKAATLQGQLPEPGAAVNAPNPLTDPTVKPGKMLLFDLEARFAKDVLERGGEAFGDWFAEDGVELSNGEAPVVGRVAIVKSANWSPKNYQLTWTPTDAAMGPSGDMGYTWGHFEGHSKDANGNPVTTSGRYMTIWRKQADGTWKVVLDAGSNEPAGAGDCCKLPAGN
jgi:ketosteroid isomerase-like protein